MCLKNRRMAIHPCIKWKLMERVFNNCLLKDTGTLNELIAVNL